MDLYSHICTFSSLYNFCSIKLNFIKHLCISFFIEKDFEGGSGKSRPSSGTKNSKKNSGVCNSVINYLPLGSFYFDYLNFFFPILFCGLSSYLSYWFGLPLSHIFKGFNQNFFLG